MSTPAPALARTLSGRFLGALAEWETARLVVLGVPMDHTTSFRPGTREAPRRIREVSDALESYSPRFDRDLTACAVWDGGDLELPWGGVVEALQQVEQAVMAILGAGRRPLILGGEHLLTLGAVRAAARLHPELAVVQLDAHADLRNDYLGQQLSHATVMRRIGEQVGFARIFQVGVRSGVPEEWELARRCGPVAGTSLVEAARYLRRELAGRPFYLTCDIDVVDPAFAPGTGTPEPGGATSQEIIEAVAVLAACGPVAVDIVEVSPPRDLADVTALLAAKLAREVLAGWAGSVDTTGPLEASHP